MTNKVSVKNHVWFWPALAALFVVLKLTGIIASWSWWWVLSPLWLPIAIVALIFIFAALIVAFKK